MLTRLFLISKEALKLLFWAWRHRSEAEFQVQMARRIREVFEKLGPTFIKLGQTLSMRPDFIPQAYCSEFEKCLDQAPALPFSQISQALNSELKKPRSQIFSHIDARPLAAASLSQVHKATLVSGQKVAIKVLRPGVGKLIQQDIRVIYFFVRLFSGFGHLGKMGKSHWLDLVHRVKIWLQEEIDYHQEAKNIKLMQEEMVEFDDFIFPSPHPRISTKRVLVMDLIEGWSLNHLIKLRRKNKLPRLPFDPVERTIRIIQVMGSMSLGRGYYHADLHPANVIFTPKGEIAILDFGLIKFFDLNQRKGALFFMLGGIFGNVDIIIRSFDKIAEKTSGLYDERRLRHQMEKATQAYVGQPASIISNGQMAVRLINICLTHGVKFDWDIMLYVRSALSMDGMILGMCPEYVFSTSNRQHYITSYLKIIMEEFASVPNLIGLSDDIIEIAKTAPSFFHDILQKKKATRTSKQH